MSLAKLSPEKKIYLLTLLATFVLAGTSWFSFWATSRLFKAFDWVYHTHLVLEKISFLSNELANIQRATRGYAITGQEDYLEPYYNATHAIPGTLLDLATLTKDNPRQQAALALIAPEIDSFLKLGAKTVALRKTAQGEENVARFIKRGMGQTEIGSILRTIDRMTAEEKSLLDRRSAEERRMAQITQWALSIITVSMVFTLVFFGFNISRHIANEKMNTQKLREQDMTLIQFLESLPIGVLVTGPDGKPFYLNKTGVNLLGRNLLPHEELGDLMRSYQLYVEGTNEIYPVEKGGIAQALQGKKTIINNIEIHKPDGKIIPIEAWGTPIFDSQGRLTHATVAFMDISERKKYQAELLSLSIHDELTGVLNRRGFLALAQQRLKNAERAKTSAYLFFIDLDELKNVNDTLGHQVGDEMISEFTRAVASCFKQKDLVGRMGGDEFAVLVEDHAVDAHALIRRLKKKIEKSAGKEGRFQLGFSVGLATYDPAHPISLEKLLWQADQKMYEEKVRKKSDPPGGIHRQGKPHSEEKVS